jgi:hypothetical protein
VRSIRRLRGNGYDNHQMLRRARLPPVLGRTPAF